MLSTCFKDTATLINLCRIIYCELDNGCLIMSYYVNCFKWLISNNIYPNLIFLFILTVFKPYIVYNIINFLFRMVK